MQLSVAHPFSNNFAKLVSNFTEVKELYGKMTSDIFGGGRSSYTLAQIGKKEVVKAVKEAHEHGVEFNYLLNAAHLGGLEQTRSGQKQIINFLDFLHEVKVDNLTVASPYLLNVIKKRHPSFKVRIGVFAVVDSAQKAEQWVSFGADTICISAIACNRDFEKLKDIRKRANCDLQLIVNANCQPHCAYELTHMNMLSQSSTSRDPLGGFCMDYCYLHCTKDRLNNPVHFIKSTWIRPEDLHFYEEIGYNNFKIVDRSTPPDLLLKRVKAYTERKFAGNLYELVGTIAQIKKEQGLPFIRRVQMVRYFLKQIILNPVNILRFRTFANKSMVTEFSKENAPIYIDNSKLDGFLEGFKKINCEKIGCEACGYCKRVADLAVKIDSNYTEDMLQIGNKIEKNLYTGSMWE